MKELNHKKSMTILILIGKKNTFKLLSGSPQDDDIFVTIMVLAGHVWLSK